MVIGLNLTVNSIFIILDNKLYFMGKLVICGIIIKMLSINLFVINLITIYIIRINTIAYMGLIMGFIVT